MTRGYRTTGATAAVLANLTQRIEALEQAQMAPPSLPAPCREAALMLGQKVKHAAGEGEVVAVAPGPGVVRVQAGSLCWFLRVEDVRPAKT